MKDGVQHLMLQSLPAGLVEELSEARRIRPAEVDRGRQRADDRSFDDGDVVEEIAVQLLVISA